MPFELSPDTPPALVPIAWLVGVWAGAGVVGYPTMEGDLRFGQEVEFSHDGRPFLSYRSQTWLLDEEGARVRPLAGETGYWRVVAPDAAGAPALEVLLVHPTGVAEIFLGSVEGASIRLHTDLVARTVTAKEYTAATRLYGLVEGDLMWVLEMAAMGHPLGAHASARLKRV